MWLLNPFKNFKGEHTMDIINSVLFLLSIISYCYLYTIYESNKKLLGLRIIVFSIFISVLCFFFDLPSITITIFLIIGGYGFIPVFMPVFNNVFVKDVSFLEAASMSILLSFYLLNIVYSLNII